ncbi:branched-chain alpha-keto acid dehydrogenase subunit E2 [Candidatus Thiomargarita nelsonii]|uniref:Acetyltransferase component of pyruvate dehydrogenase complex n=1 Tax=Candidatus Thiomargarita nelsonii TaxID=1003181 RepID=A0A4E0QSZ4_9GAMM|nr:branched-chain alpha-keto acid dehydrogenase subunit E2 [Candidatus Thiomargarita nelsonii]
MEIKLPDIGDFKDVPILEILVNSGDSVEIEQTLITLESDKATIEIPSPHAGVVKEIKVNVGDKVSDGSVILTMEVGPVQAAPPPLTPSTTLSGSDSVMAALRRPKNLPSPLQKLEKQEVLYAGPAVRHLARELGVDLAKVKGSGRKGRILKEDVQAFVKQVMEEGSPLDGGGAIGMGIPEMPEIDFSKFGEIEIRPLSRINKISGASLHRSWLNVPHVTQFDEADITELEKFRKDLAGKKRQVKVTMLAFLLKACAGALREFPEFNASLDASKENLILKQYYNIGVAVDTPKGLVVPVIKEVDKKGLFELAANLGEISQKARDGKLSPTEMQGAGFTISSLGGIGGTAFTPIVNAPEVAILGVSRSKMQPVYRDGEFVPRLMLPLSLSYDHRVIDGAMGARFTQYLSFILSDVRRLLL